MIKYNVIIMNNQGCEDTRQHQKGWQTLPISSKTFYNNLEFYKPVFQIQGEQVPVCLANQTTSTSLFLIIVMNIFSLLACISLWNIWKEDTSNNIIILSALILNSLSLLALDISYVLTMNLNPGIFNLEQISQETYQKQGKVFCIYCEQHRTLRMTHCKKCKVCIEDIDHHCDILGRCVGGQQSRPFYALLMAVVVVFVTFVVCLIISISYI